MFHARMFNEKLSYRNAFWDEAKKFPKEDRPVIVQFCGGDADQLLRAAKVVEPHCDAVDINCGCPQGIARRGNYGAFLLEQGDLLVSIVQKLVENLSVPVTVKVRILPSGVEPSLDLYRRLIDAGASMLTIHGRTRHQKGHDTGVADWGAIKRVVQEFGHILPIIANGGISNMDDVRKCIEFTGADGVMSSEAVLEYPALFSGDSHTSESGHKRKGPGKMQLAREYLALAEAHPTDVGGQGSGLKCVRTHLHHFLHGELQENPIVRDAAVVAYSYEELWNVIEKVELHRKDQQHTKENEIQDWYFRHRILGENGEYVAKSLLFGKTQKIQQIELDDDTGGCMAGMFGGDDDDCW